MAFSRLNTLFRATSIGASRSYKTIRIPLTRHLSSISFARSTIPKVSYDRAYIQQFHSTAKLREEEGKTSEEAVKKAKESETKPQEEKKDPTKVLQDEIADLKSKLVYSYAERENIRRIGNQEVEKARDYGIQSFAKSLLDSADNISRCLKSVSKEHLQDATFKTFYEGVELTERNLFKAFKANGLEKYNPSDQKFDPNTMNAQTFIPNPAKEHGIVLEVTKNGYLLKNRCIRPADVIVNNNPSPSSDTATQ